MNKHRFLKFGVLMIALSIIVPTSVYADRDERHDYKQRDHDRYERREHSKKDFRLDKRYRHHLSYPRQGYSVKALPIRHHPIRYRNKEYYYGGVWYRPSGMRFTAVLPPIGIVVPMLPAFYNHLDRWHALLLC